MIEEVSSDKKVGGSLAFEEKKREKISIISKSLQNICCENKDDFS